MNYYGCLFTKGESKPLQRVLLKVGFVFILMT